MGQSALLCVEMVLFMAMRHVMMEPKEDANSTAKALIHTFLALRVAP
jgi:hypothetical protein